MKTSPLLPKCLALLILLGTAISCRQTTNESVQPDATPLTANTEKKLTNLLERALQEGDKDDYSAITEEYKKLDFNELELFNKLKTESDNKRVVQKMSKSGARVSQQQLMIMTEALQQVNSLRTDVNKQSVAVYGVPYNQIADSLLNKLLDEQALSHAIDMPNFDPEPSTTDARGRQPSGCTVASFPYVSSKISNGNLDWNYWGSKRTPGTNDCDYEFRYSGYRFDFDPKDWFADRLCDSFNNKIARRSDNTYTRLLFGNRGVWLWIGYPGLTSVEMRK